MQTLEIVKASDETLELYLVDAIGNPYSTENGEQVVFGVKKTEGIQEPIFCVVGISQGNGLYTFEIYGSYTEKLEHGDYVYDVGLKKGDQFRNVIPLNRLILIDNVTSKECFG